MFKLRPHHGLCIHHFAGKGYSRKFVKNMTEIIAQLNCENPHIELVLGADEICKACPNLINGKCTSETKVQKIDKGCLVSADLGENTVIKYKDYKEIINNKITNTGKGKSICQSCEWYDLCYY